MLSVQEACWRILIPLIGAFVCAFAAHKKDVTTEREYSVSWFENQSFFRNFFLNANFALMINLMYMISGRGLDYLVVLLTCAMIGFTLIVSHFFPDVPHRFYENPKVKNATIWATITAVSIIVLTVLMPIILN